MLQDPVAMGDVLLAADSFRRADAFDHEGFAVPGLYAIRVADVAALPDPFRAFAARADGLLYVGKATRSLRKRLVEEELRAKRHATFFRGIGAVLGYRPVPGSLVGKVNRNNFVFASRDRLAIATWLDRYAEASAFAVPGDLAEIERDLIRRFTPLLNLDHNPAALAELVAVRQTCREIALGDS